MITQLIIKQVTNNLCDVFFGEFGFDRKEHVRMKRAQGTWIPCGTRKVHQDEIDYGCIVPLEAVLPAITGVLNVSFKRKAT
ncbi:hypothetical protein UFOVP1590_40 [uncultured Caudovirales phage]|uniref:Uncharacterized protein n=1 Tax=uncultured Caudovirales phage TaxID=2100421 RepID=A0A6J5SPB2_9CAUD|nr:hypothetical protein UFOVP1590_40 [uncultured Caudovirales phage]